MRIGGLVILAGALALGACGRGAPEGEQAVNEAANDVVEVLEEPAPANNAAPQNKTANATLPAAPPPQISEEEQMLDDADATGLTARLPESGSEPPIPTANETQPAE